ncbi:GNAT family N-acetyltransferase [Sphingorhabdus sp.]|mgnify:CR=1 FL=1|jgi:GNAT superfamily N-acetyltransferase|uniref:GNAT family N-acetyltransferase n=1 Tax=Sphingorhabdus sp. TaxID=1902408 RepID=UPI003BAEE2BE|nr:GNAT family N-acetyltransferase [Sphingomonadales bacterium]MBK9432522.1 GNAT family N-acetyltransferase [Sphingomonadales bacterium]
MTPIHWRKAVSGDEEALSLLGQATFLATFAFDHPGPALIRFLQDLHSPDFYAAKLADPQIDIIIGETPLGAPVAYAMLCPPEHPDFQRDGDWELKRIYLLGPWQGGGNGGALLEQAVECALKRQAKRMLLAVYENNDRAVGFYKKHGFSKIGDTIFMVDDVEFHDMLLARSLTM